MSSHRNAESVLFGAIAVASAGVVIGFPLFAALALRTVPAVHASVVVGLIPIVQAVLLVLASVALSRWSQLHPHPRAP